MKTVYAIATMMIVHGVHCSSYMETIEKERRLMGYRGLSSFILRRFSADEHGNTKREKLLATIYLQKARKNELMVSLYFRFEQLFNIIQFLRTDSARSFYE